MAYLFEESIAATASEKNLADLNVPANATGADLQADTQDVRYTMDGTTVPTQTTGMVFVVGNEPEPFLIEDVKNIKFVRGAGSDGQLNLHYWAGRDV